MKESLCYHLSDILEESFSESSDNSCISSDRGNLILRSMKISPTLSKNFIYEKDKAMENLSYLDNPDYDLESEFNDSLLSCPFDSSRF